MELPRVTSNRTQHAGMGKATAHHSAQGIAYLLVSRIRRCIEQRLGRENHAAEAITALGCPFIDECLLYGVRLLCCAKPFQRGDGRSTYATGGLHAGTNDLRAHKHGAGAALGHTASEVGRVQTQLILQHVKEGRLRIYIDRVGGAIDLKSQLHESLCNVGLWKRQGPRQQVFDPHRQVAYADTGGMIDGIGDGRCYAGQSNFSHTAHAERIQFVVRMVKEGYVDVRRIRVDGHDVVGEIVVDGRAAAAVVHGFFEQSHAYPHDHSALDLVARKARVKDASGINYGDNTVYAQPCDLRLPADLNELGSVGMKRIFRLSLSQRSLRFTGAGDAPDIRDLKNLRHGYGSLGLPFEANRD